MPQHVLIDSIQTKVSFLILLIPSFLYFFCYCCYIYSVIATFIADEIQAKNVHIIDVTKRRIAFYDEIDEFTKLLQLEATKHLTGEHYVTSGLYKALPDYHEKCAESILCNKPHVKLNADQKKIRNNYSDSFKLLQKPEGHPANKPLLQACINFEITNKCWYKQACYMIHNLDNKCACLVNWKPKLPKQTVTRVRSFSSPVIYQNSIANKFNDNYDEKKNDNNYNLPPDIDIDMNIPIPTMEWMCEKCEEFNAGIERRCTKCNAPHPELVEIRKKQVQSKKKITNDNTKIIPPPPMASELQRHMSIDNDDDTETEYIE